MSLPVMSAQQSQSSVFTYESTGHPCHVLRRLDDQRRRDVLCDVTVVVEGQSFRAHRSVLASCSEYFTDRASYTSHEAVITLPREVTAAGFEPLLKFAYTSKLLFSKNNVLETRTSAAILGFRDLDEACFDFLLPKLLSSSTGCAALQRLGCRETRCKWQLSKAARGMHDDAIPANEREEKPVSDSPSKKEGRSLCDLPVNGESGSKSSTSFFPHVEHTPSPSKAPTDFSLQCPKYRKFQLACGKEICSGAGGRRDQSKVETSRQTFLNNPKKCAKGELEKLFARKECGVITDRERVLDKTKTDIDKREGRWYEERSGLSVVKMEEETGVMSPSATAPLTQQVRGVSSRPSPVVVGGRSAELILDHCPLEALGEGCASTGSMRQEKLAMEVKTEKELGDTGDSDSTGPVSSPVKTEEQEMDPGQLDGGRGREERWVESEVLNGEQRVDGRERRSSMEREVVEQLALGFRSYVASPHLPPRGPCASSATDAVGEPVHSPTEDWLKVDVSLSSRPTTVCPFLQDLDPGRSVWKEAGEASLSGCEGVFPSGNSPCVSSLNSGEDGESETETEGDSEWYTSERARQVQLPFSVDCIVNLNRNDFQQLLMRQSLTREQLDFVHDVRRRSKNRIAAQRCRKRKLDCLHNLECEINRLRTEREKLMMEKSQLSQLKVTTWESVSALCQRVCSEANLQPEQLHVLAKYTSSDCPLSSFIAHIDSLMSGPGPSLQPQASCTSAADIQQASSNASTTDIIRDG
ncbi:transcription regulator protein BACH1b isoform X2 [Lampris incognitus]|uniref:transcription regulator protein BACH1b isoform X2 n=1 Tax=Lampris incognitus TaxID=2546036 RepID=UPI0024B4AC2A|nr:transcription regulator protein BACH1b isoform X2 [Lampris incognitus]